MFAETGQLARPDGARLAWQHQPAAGKPHGILLICHGLAEHARRYVPFAAHMSANGIHVYAHDHRGHGQTTAKDAPIGRFAQRNGADIVTQDVLAMHAMAVGRHPSLPVIILGHSMGGLIAMNAVLARPHAFAAAAIWNANFNTGFSGRVARIILRLERMFKGSDVPSDMLPRLTFQAWGQSIPKATTDFDWLSRDPEAVAAYIRDPLCGFDASVSLWLDVFELIYSGLDTLKTSPLRRDFPFHLAASGADPATRQGNDVVWLANHLKKHGFSNISNHIYSGMRHETWNETGSDIALSAFADWCLHVCEPQGGKAVS